MIEIGPNLANTLKEVLPLLPLIIIAAFLILKD